MSLSDIKFKYLDKIDNVNARISRYEEIIQGYSSRIEQAEKEENPNISSMIKAREQYEHKIENMLCVIDFYKEFVETADYLMQNLNNHSTVISNLKYEDLQKRNDQLQDEVEVLENRLYSLNVELDKLKISDELDKTRIKKQRNEIRELKESKKMIKVLEDENEFLKQQLKKSNKESANAKKVKRDWYLERKKLMGENITLKDTNDYLERRTQQL